MVRTSVAAVAASLLAAACGGSAPPPFRPVADTKELMNATVDPAADVIWDGAGSIITANGTEELGPKNDEEWAALRNAAVTLAESGNLLMMVPRARDGDEWMRLCEAMIETAQAAIRAAEAKSRDQVFSAGGDIYAVCTNCHSKYVIGMNRVS
jgi:hypothetical protein